MRLLQLTLLLECILSLYCGFAQNIYNNSNINSNNSIYNSENSILYCNYLLKNEYYNEAVDEFERIFAYGNYSEKIIKEFFKTCLLSKNEKCINISDNYLDSGKINNLKYYKEYLKLLVINNKTSTAINILHTNKSINEAYRTESLAYLHIINGDINNATKMLQKCDSLQINYNKEIINVYQKMKNFKKKKTSIAIILSSIIPGLGKVYSGYWKDGLHAFIYTTILGFEAYRGFERYGIKSILGWITLTGSVSFYLGNIYGTYKATKKKNNSIYKNYTDEAKIIFINNIN